MDNSIDSVLSELYRTNKNFLSLVDAMQKSHIDKTESIEFVWTDTDGNEVSKEYPSINSLLEKVNRLDKSNTEAFNYKNSVVSVRMHGGEIRRYVISEPLQSPQTFELNNPISRFSVKENIIKDKFIEPYTSIEIPVSEEIYPLYSKFNYMKIQIFADDSSINIFEQEFRNKSKSYEETIKLLNTNNVEYGRVEGIAEMLPKTLLNIGKFSVVNISYDTDNTILYSLSTLRYKNNENRDISLKVGDKLIIDRNTTYEIIRIIDSERKVALKLIDGSTPVVKGVDNLVLSSNKINNNIDIPIGSEERFIIFIKPMNPINGVVSNEWGIGRGVFIYDLIDRNNISYSNGISVNLWDKIKALAESNMVSAKNIVKPRTPILSNDFFNVELINSHKRYKSSIDRLSALNSKKESENSKIESLNISLDSIRENLANVNLSQNEIKELKNDELRILEEQNVIRKSLKNISYEIVELVNSNIEFSPKYAVIGVVPFTEPMYEDPTNKIGRQDIIAYELEYRYKSKDGDIQEFKNRNISNASESVDFIASKWVKHEQIFRKRNEQNRFVDEVLTDPNVTKPNQYHIPISSNEIIEVRIRGLSESGYPMKEIYSDWSNVIEIAFPQELEENVDNLIETSKNEKIFNEFQNELSREKLIGHASDSFENKDVSFKHHALNIATDEKTPEQGNLSVQAVLNLFKLDIEQLRQIVSAQDGSIKIRILDENDMEVASVKNNTVVSINGGLYSELVRGLEDPKGSIINHTYYLEIENVGEGELEVISYITGKQTNPLTANYDGYIFNPTEYTAYRKYDKVSIAISDIPSANDFTFGKYNQNKQVQGQFLYSRFRDMSLSNDLYVEDSVGLHGLDIGTQANTTQPFIWNGSQTTGANPAGNGRYTDFCVHVKHPYLVANNKVMQNYSVYSLTGFLPNKNFDASSNSYVYPPFAHSKYASINSSEPNANKQLYCKTFNKITNNASLSDQILKNSFYPEDQYLIGKRTCGLYLNLGAMNRDSIEIKNNSYNTGEKLLKGEKRLIPIYASSRLTDYYGTDNSGKGNVGGVLGNANVKYEKTIGIDVLYKSKSRSELFSFDIKYSIQYQNGNI